MANASSSTAASTPVLRVLTGQSAGKSFAMTDGRLVIGRDEQAGIPLDDSKASREHVEIVRRDGNYLVKDLGSRNGTLLNGAALSEAVTLKNGDRIRIGLSEIEFVDPTNHLVRLRVLEGTNPDAVFALDRERLTLGRTSEANIALHDSKSSKENAEITCQDGVYRVRDLDSRNGTFLNDQKLVGEATLKHGDRIRIGLTLLEFLDLRDDLAACKIPGYALDRRIGCGSIGAVYRADAGDDGGPVAIKLLDPGRAQDPRELARFLNAGRAMQRLSHPNIVSVIQAEVADKQPYVIMEWLPRGSLAERLAAGEALPAETVIALARDIARGLEAAEAKDVFHLGLRPSNILFDREATALVSDFALCQPFNHQQPAHGADPRYIAPEELSGAAADAKANQFSLGALLYHALTGKPPFAGANTLALANARLDQALPVIDSAAIPRPLLLVVSRLLARSPRNRYPSWTAVLADLDAVASDAPVPGPAIDDGLSALAVPEAGRRRSAQVTNRVNAPIQPRLSQQLGIPRIAIHGMILLAVLLVVVLFVLPPVASYLSRPGAVAPTVPALDAPDPPGFTLPTQVPIPVADPRPDIAGNPPKPAKIAPSNGDPVPTPSEILGLSRPTGTPPPTIKADLAPAPKPVARPRKVISVVAVSEPIDGAAPTPPATSETSASPAEAPTSVNGGPQLGITACRADTWETGTLTLADGTSLRGQFLVKDDEVAFKDPAAGRERHFGASTIKHVTFDPPKNPAVAAADSNFKRKCFAEAADGYQKALAKDPGHPYLVAQLAEAQRLRTSETPAILAQAVQSAESGQPPKETVRLFLNALKANVALGDRDYFLLAKAYHDGGNNTAALVALERVSAAYAETPEVEALRASIKATPAAGHK